MKRIHLLQGVFIGLVLMISSCTTTIPMEVLRPADIVIDANIQTIALVDRSRPSSGFLNVLGGLVSGERIGQAREGRENAMVGVSNVLSRTPRFTVVQTGIAMEGSKGGRRMAPPLIWSEVERICESVNADALAVIESYDLSYSTSSSEQERKKKDKDGNEYVEKFWQANANMDIKIGWRVYDPSKRIIIDEFVSNAGQNYSSEGANQQQSFDRLPNPVRSSGRISLGIGEAYAERIAPVYIFVNRTIYNTGKKPFKEDMKQAAQLVRVGNWDAAKSKWNDIIGAADAKTSAKACVNMAIAYEHEGNFAQAQKYVEKALIDYGFKSAQGYANQLNIRMREEDRANQQMQNKRN